MKKKDAIIRVDKEFERIIKKLAVERVRARKDEKMRSSRRITKAIRRHPLFREIERDIIHADFEDD